MRAPPDLRRLRLLAVIALASAALLAPSPLLPQDPDPEFRLHQTFKACGKKWAKKAARLSQEQLAWMLQRDHRLVEVSLEGVKVLTLEILSGPSLRDCDVVNRWDRRETSIRATYYLADGSSRTTLANFSDDHVFFNEQPAILAAAGRALLKGVTADGTAVARWLDLEPLGELYAAAARRLAAEAVLASK